MLVSLFLLVALGGASAAGPQGTLIVCVEEARDLADLDASEEKTFGSEGSDAFVAIFPGPGLPQSTRDQYDLTAPVPDTAHPVWNECFSLRGAFDADSEISFVVLDADGPGNVDDVIGTACTTAGSQQRWLDLSGPTAADTSERGRIKVRTLLFVGNATNDGAHTTALGWETAVSAYVTPVANAAAATASVACPAGKRLTSCSCASDGDPGCATAHVESAVERMGLETCVATAHAYVPAPPLPPCAESTAASAGGASVRKSGKDAQARPGVTCAPPGWVPPGPEPILAVARCADLGTTLGPGDASSYEDSAGIMGGTAWNLHDETSAPSRAARRDATEAVCSRGLLTGCSEAGTAGGLGTRVEDGDGDGRPECVAYSAGEAPAVAQARCATLTASGKSDGGTYVSLPIMARTEIGGSGGGLWTTATCPAPFRMAGCSCFSENNNCVGATILSDGAHHVDTCNATHRMPLTWWRAGGEAHALCLWLGDESQLLGPSTRGDACSEPAGDAGPGHIPDKAWLPPDWRSKLRVSSTSGGTDGSGRRAKAYSQGILGAGFMLGALFAFSLVCVYCTCACVLNARKQRELGGAPTMPTGGPVRAGDVVVVSNTAGPGYTAPVVPVVPVATAVPSVGGGMSAPLVLADSAQVGSRV